MNTEHLAALRQAATALINTRQRRPCWWPCAL
jgi:hypothetical protein